MPVFSNNNAPTDAVRVTHYTLCEGNDTAPSSQGWAFASSHPRVRRVVYEERGPSTVVVTLYAVASMPPDRRALIERHRTKEFLRDEASGLPWEAVEWIKETLPAECAAALEELKQAGVQDEQRTF